MKKQNPTLRDELLEHLKRIEEDRIMSENRRTMRPFGPGRFSDE